jgi:hypothetical protein
LCLVIQLFPKLIVVQYPTFRLLNKQTRVSLSSQPLSPNPNHFYRLFATANTKGWFAAVTSSGLICSPLPDLSLAFKSNSTPFTPKRTIPLFPGATPTIIAFASAETRLVVAFDGGQLAVYDSSALFTPGSETIQPLHVLETHTGTFRQIAPNPGNDPALVDTLAVVRGDGCVQLLNTRLESQGGWTGSDMESTPVAGTYSSNHLAIQPLSFLSQSPGLPKANTSHLASTQVTSSPFSHPLPPRLTNTSHAQRPPLPLSSPSRGLHQAIHFAHPMPQAPNRSTPPITSYPSTQNPLLSPTQRPTIHSYSQTAHSKLSCSLSPVGTKTMPVRRNRRKPSWWWRINLPLTSRYSAFR